MSALDRWREALEAWAIPDEILSAAAESPWGFPPELFRRRVARAIEEPTVLAERAREALPEGGTVLDVGVGGGATSLPLADRASRISGVDGSEDMLEGFRASASEAGAAAETVHGRWPEIAAVVPTADIVVCGHVLYNVPDLSTFLVALTDHARRRVVVEITGLHPLSWMNDLWIRFHGLERPSGPSADDAEAVLRELDLDPSRDDRTVEPRAGGFERKEDAVALVRRRLCLSADRDGEIADALGHRLLERDGLWHAGPLEQSITTFWWDGAAEAAGRR